MKKVYVAPEVEVVVMSNNNILAGSLGVDPSTETATQYSKEQEYWSADFASNDSYW